MSWALLAPAFEVKVFSVLLVSMNYRAAFVTRTRLVTR